MSLANPLMRLRPEILRLSLQVTPDQSIALVEYIAHLSVEDWDMIPYDLAQLGFLPPGDP